MADETRGTEITIRDMRPEDREAVLSLARGGWSWGNYLPDVLDRWMSEPTGVVRVAETSDGRVIGTHHYQQLDSSQCWLSGLRIHPEFRGRGVSGLFLEDAIRLAAVAGLRTLRYACELTDEAVHQLSRKYHLRPRGTWLTFERLLDADACHVGRTRTGLGASTCTLTPRDKMRVLSLLQASGRNLYVRSWIWRDLDEAALEDLIGRGSTFFSRSGVGSWSLAVVSVRSARLMEITLLSTDSSGANSVLEFIRRIACEESEGVDLVLHVPEDSPAAALLGSLARRGEWKPVTEHPVRVWELDLAG